ncbi:MAG: class I SAM-dependent methyltransferase [Chloroflexi bacterium]|nr:class I SAM-dependent methyltransferase [Chloroflexota bacterium]
MEKYTLTKRNNNLWEKYVVPLDSYRIESGLSLLPPIHEGRVLDIGCADGSLGKKLNEIGWKSYGIDINFQNTKLTLQKNVLSTLCDLESDFPFRDRSFDAIVAFEVIEHLVDTRQFINECYRILKPNGYLILTTPNLASFSNRIRLLFGQYPAWMDYDLESGSGHIRYFTSTILRLQTESLGFHLEKKRGSAIPIPFLSRLWGKDNSRFDLFKILGRLFPNFSTHVIFRLRK